MDIQIAVDRAQDRLHFPRGHVGRPGVRAVAGDRRARIDARGAGALLRGDETLALHRGEHEVRALLRELRRGDGIDARRRLERSREQCRLAQVELRRGFAEIASRGRVHARRAVAEPDAVEVELQDLVLGEPPLQPKGEHQLLHLAPERAAAGQEQVLGELLRERRAALAQAARPDVARHRSRETDGVETVVRAETVVLDGDHGLRQERAHLVERQFARADAAMRDEAPARVEDADVRRALGHGPGVGVGQLRRVPGEERENREPGPKRADRAPVEGAAQRARGPGTLRSPSSPPACEPPASPCRRASPCGWSLSAQGARPSRQGPAAMPPSSVPRCASWP